MRLLLAVLLASFIGACAQQPARPPLPIIDMHLHAQGADLNAPSGVCAPFSEFPPRDPRVDWGATFGSMMKQGCENPVPSARTDDAMMTQTLEILSRRNIIGVFSALDGLENDPMGLVTRWHGCWRTCSR